MVHPADNIGYLQSQQLISNPQRNFSPEVMEAWDLLWDSARLESPDTNTGNSSPTLRNASISPLSRRYLGRRRMLSSPDLDELRSTFRRTRRRLTGPDLNSERDHLNEIQRRTGMTLNENVSTENWMTSHRMYSLGVMRASEEYERTMRSRRPSCGR
nr:MAG: hypothetical protein [Chemarfal virus 193]